MEIKIKASIDYDFEKQEFFLARFDVEEVPEQKTVQGTVRKEKAEGLERLTCS